MENDQISLMGAEEIEKDQLDGFTAKEQELIHQLVQERLGKKGSIEFESLDEYVVPPKWISTNLSSPLAGSRRRRHRCSVRVLNAEVPSVRR